jgi:hypothetical protein
MTPKQKREMKELVVKAHVPGLKLLDWWEHGFAAGIKSESNRSKGLVEACKSESYFKITKALTAYEAEDADE